MTLNPNVSCPRCQAAAVISVQEVSGTPRPCPECACLLSEWDQVCAAGHALWDARPHWSDSSPEAHDLLNEIGREIQKLLPRALACPEYAELTKGMDLD